VTIDGIIRQFKNHGTYTTPRKGHRRRRGKIPGDQLNFLASHLFGVDAILFLGEMQQLLFDKYGTKYYKSLICSTLIRKGITRHKLERHAVRRSAQERAIFRRTMAGFSAEQVLSFAHARSLILASTRHSLARSCLYREGRHGARTLTNSKNRLIDKGFYLVFVCVSWSLSTRRGTTR